VHQSTLGNFDGIVPIFHVEEIVGLFGGSKYYIFKAVWPSALTVSVNCP